MTEPLKPCPHCGGVAKAWSRLTADNPPPYVACAICDATAPNPAAWNRRAPVALPTREEVARTIWDALGGWKEWDETHEESMTEATPIDVRSAADAILALMKGEGR